MDLLQLVLFGLQTSILLTVFGFGLHATVEDVLYLARRPSLLARSLVAMFVVMPLAAVALTGAFDVRPVVEITLITLAISPVPPLLPGKGTRAGGSAAYALGLMATAAVLSIALVPIAVRVLGQYFSQPFTMPPSAIAQVVLKTTLLPLVAGMGARAALPNAARRLASPVGKVAGILLVASVVPILFSRIPAASDLVGGGTLAVMACLAVFGLGAGHLLGGGRHDEKVVLALSTATRHPAMAFAVARTNFPAESQLGAAILLYLLVSAIAGALYMALGRRHTTATITPSRA